VISSFYFPRIKFCMHFSHLSRNLSFHDFIIPIPVGEG
jgi:hypothetical protein